MKFGSFKFTPASSWTYLEMPQHTDFHSVPRVKRGLPAGGLLALAAEFRRDSCRFHRHSQLGVRGRPLCATFHQFESSHRMSCVEVPPEIGVGGERIAPRDSLSC